MIASRTGLMTGRVRKLQTPRASLGKSPARRKDDFRPRGAKNDHQAWGGGFAQAAQFVEPLHDRRIATEEDACILGFKRLEAAIGRPFGIALRWPGEETRVEPCLRQPGPQPPEAFL